MDNTNTTPIIHQLPPTLDTIGLAGLLHRHPTSIRNDLYLRPDRIPAPLPRSRRQKILWDTATCLNWLREGRSAPEKTKRRGAPTKAERLAKGGAV